MSRMREMSEWTGTTPNSGSSGTSSQPGEHASPVLRDWLLSHADGADTYAPSPMWTSTSSASGPWRSSASAGAT